MPTHPCPPAALLAVPIRRWRTGMRQALTAAIQPIITPMAMAALTVLATMIHPAHAQDKADGLPADSSAAMAGTDLDLSWSVFGTLGAAQSDKRWYYQRYIHDQISFDRDSLLGGQLDLQFNPQWSATVQLRAAPSTDSDSRWSVTPTWAFVGWRPDNEWQVRVGKLRVPFLLRSEQLDVGQTYDEARLPAEIYTLVPTSDYVGAHVAHAWALDHGDLSLDGYVGSSDSVKRFWTRQAIPSMVPGQPDLLPAGANFLKVNIRVAGLALTWRDPDLMARVGIHHASTALKGRDTLVRPSWVDFGNGLGYWQTNGEGLERVPRVRNWLLTAGAEGHLGGGWRASGELMRIWQRDTELGIDGWAGYGTLYRSWGDFTPYATFSAAHSSNIHHDWVGVLDSTTVPDMVPGAALMNASMRASADTVPTLRQHSLALGSAYAIDARSKLKVEWLHSWIEQSYLLDLPADAKLRQSRQVNVLSLSYSFAF